MVLRASEAEDAMPTSSVRTKDTSEIIGEQLAQRVAAIAVIDVTDRPPRGDRVTFNKIERSREGQLRPGGIMPGAGCCQQLAK